MDCRLYLSHAQVLVQGLSQAVLPSSVMQGARTMHDIIDAASRSAHIATLCDAPGVLSEAKALLTQLARF